LTPLFGVHPQPPPLPLHGPSKRSGTGDAPLHEGAGAVDVHRKRKKKEIIVVISMIFATGTDNEGFIKPE